MWPRSLRWNQSPDVKRLIFYLFNICFFRFFRSLNGNIIYQNDFYDLFEQFTRQNLNFTYHDRDLINNLFVYKIIIVFRILHSKSVFREKKLFYCKTSRFLCLISITYTCIILDIIYWVRTKLTLKTVYGSCNISVYSF